MISHIPTAFLYHLQNSIDVDVDGRASDVDEPVVLIIAAAEWFLRTGRASTSADNSDWGAVKTDTTEDINVNGNLSMCRRVLIVLIDCLSLLTTLDVARVTLAASAVNKWIGDCEKDERRDRQETNKHCVRQKNELWLSDLERRVIKKELMSDLN